MKLAHRVANVLAPYECLACGIEGDVVCSTCLPALLDASRIPSRCFVCHKQTENSKTCTKCRKQKPLAHVWVGTTNSGVAAKLVQTMKFNPDRSVALLIADWLDNVMSHIVVDMVAPVPTARARVRQRGFDHTSLLAKEFAKLRALPYCSALARHGSSRQVGATRTQRLLQLSDAYEVTTKEITGKHILLIDDVTTTGATLKTAAKALKRGGAKSVDALVFAQTI